MHTIKDLDTYADNFVRVHQGTDQPEISIVMPIYNCEEFVTSAINSILSQQDVVAEIIISDDNSTDKTFACAYHTVMDHISTAELPHTVLMRAGTTRLQRDHLHLLANTASCDLVCQAHGDDISHPLRCSLLVKAFNNPDHTVSMIFVNPITIDHQGKILQEPKNLSVSNIPVVPIEYRLVIDAQHATLIGSNMAWRKSAFKDFPQLTTAYCLYGHDRVMTFRSYLVGGCYLLDAPLLKRRIHTNNFHKELMSSDHKPINLFNHLLIKLSVFSAMQNDLIFLKNNNIIDQNKFNQHLKDIINNVMQITKLLTTTTSTLVLDGYVNKWIK